MHNLSKQLYLKPVKIHRFQKVPWLKKSMGKSVKIIDMLLQNYRPAEVEFMAYLAYRLRPVLDLLNGFCLNFHNAFGYRFVILSDSAPNLHTASMPSQTR